jgi:multicomponent Na+:H+ antiporter subunit E
MKKLKLVYYIPEFLVFYILALVQSNFQVAAIILSPKLKTRAEFIEFPVRVKSSAGLLLLSNLVSMTPGTLSVDISDDKKTLVVHALLINDKQNTHQSIESIQKRILRLTN